MKTELQRTLFDAFPLIFADRHKPMTQTAMCWGIECGDGWYDLLYDLCWLIQGHIDGQRALGKPVPQVVAIQVKEKFGGLRFYYRGGDDYIAHVVSAFEELAGTRCEVCGAHGQRYGGGWIRTLCEHHAETPDQPDDEELP
jgi:hypothetical protein